jgi:hypothetical protein
VGSTIEANRQIFDVQKDASGLVFEAAGRSAIVHE